MIILTSIVVVLIPWTAMVLIYFYTNWQLKEVFFWGLTLINMVAGFGLFVYLLRRGLESWIIPIFWYEFLFGIPMLIMAMVGSAVESDKERSERYARGEEKM